MHFLRIEDYAICGDLVSPSCLCHPSKKVLPKPNVAVPIVGKFYCVNYVFVSSKSQSPLTMCSKSREQGQWFGYICKIDQDDVSLVDQENMGKLLTL